MKKDIDTRLLNKKIAESGLKKGIIAQNLGLTRAGLSKKVNCMTEFKANEIQALAIILKLSKDEVFDIFFADYVGKKATN